MQQRKKRPPSGFKKVVTRLSLDNWGRVEEIRDKYGFKSVYEINQYLWACFLRVADPEHEENDDPVPDEIADMFHDYAMAERRFNYIKPKKCLPQYKVDEMNGQGRLKFTE